MASVRSREFNVFRVEIVKCKRRLHLKNPIAYFFHRELNKNAKKSSIKLCKIIFTEPELRWIDEMDRIAKLESQVNYSCVLRVFKKLYGEKIAYE